MCEVKTEYKKYVHVENRLKVLYLRLMKYIYGCMESALLCSDIYSETLNSHRFIASPYTRCIANRTIKSNKWTISWYVQDNKVSNTDEEVNTKVIETVSNNSVNFVVSRKKKHKFLGMYIEFLADGKIIAIHE